MVTLANNQTFFGANLDICGNGNIVSGPNCSVTGDRNIVSGPNSTVTGDRNIVSGPNATVTGDHNRVEGPNGTAVGNHNTVAHPAAAGAQNRYQNIVVNRGGVFVNGRRVDDDGENDNNNNHDFVVNHVNGGVHNEVWINGQRVDNNNNNNAAAAAGGGVPIMNHQAQQQAVEAQVGAAFAQAFAGAPFANGFYFNFNGNGDPNVNNVATDNNQNNVRATTTRTATATKRVEGPSEQDLQHDTDAVGSSACVICHVNKPICAALPCNHLAYCAACARAWCLQDDESNNNNNVNTQQQQPHQQPPRWKRRGRVQCCVCTQPVEKMVRMFFT